MLSRITFITACIIIAPAFAEDAVDTQQSTPISTEIATQLEIPRPEDVLAHLMILSGEVHDYMDVSFPVGNTDAADSTAAVASALAEHLVSIIEPESLASLGDEINSLFENEAFVKAFTKDANPFTTEGHESVEAEARSLEQEDLSPKDFLHVRKSSSTTTSTSAAPITTTTTLSTSTITSTTTTLPTSTSTTTTSEALVLQKKIIPESSTTTPASNLRGSTTSVPAVEIPRTLFENVLEIFIDTTTKVLESAVSYYNHLVTEYPATIFGAAGVAAATVIGFVVYQLTHLRVRSSALPISN